MSASGKMFVVVLHAFWPSMADFQNDVRLPHEGHDVVRGVTDSARSISQKLFFISLRHPF